LFYFMKKIINHVGEDVKVGRNVKIWNFTYIGDGTEIGDNTRIGSLVHVDYDVRIGRDCKIEGIVYIPPLTEIGDRVFIGPGAVFTNDPYPPSERLTGIHVGDDAVICAGAVLMAGIKVGARSVIGMGAVVTRDVAPDTVVYGTPARAAYPTSSYVQKRSNWRNAASSNETV